MDYVLSCSESTLLSVGRHWNWKALGWESAVWIRIEYDPYHIYGVLVPKESRALMWRLTLLSMKDAMSPIGHSFFLKNITWLTPVCHVPELLAFGDSCSGQMYLSPLMGHRFEMDRGNMWYTLSYNMCSITETYNLVNFAEGSSGSLESPRVVLKLNLH